MAVKLKRAYEPAAAEDGLRYLVERLWPRGVSRKDLKLTKWLRDIAPSTDLRKWYGHADDRWSEFRRRYRKELRAPDKQQIVHSLAQEARTRSVTLVFATKDVERSGASVLKSVIQDVRV